jgi:hypothetical protein
MEKATFAVAVAAAEAGLDTTWPTLNQLARDAMKTDPEQMTAAQWLALRDRIAAGEWTAS